MAAKKPRLSLTKSQILAGAGAELLALCQTVTEDGSLSKKEIVELREWLESNRSSELPAIEFLASTLERILADKKVTVGELAQLYAAIEMVLPPEARRVAVSQRKAVEAEEKARERQEREALKQQDREEREKSRPLSSLNFMVAGVHYEGRAAIIEEHVEEGDTVYLARDPDNQFSRNAVEVRLRNGLQIGFVPEMDASDVAPFLNQGLPHIAHVTKILTGGRAPIPVVQAYVHREDAGIEGLVFPKDVPEKQRAPSSPPPLRLPAAGPVGEQRAPGDTERAPIRVTVTRVSKSTYQMVCPSCGGTTNFRESTLGGVTKCRNCGFKIELPSSLPSSRSSGCLVLLCLVSGGALSLIHSFLSS